MCVLLNECIVDLDMIKSSRLSTKATISSVLGKEYTEPGPEEEKELRRGGIVQGVDHTYVESDDDSMGESSDESSDEELDNPVTFSPFCAKFSKKEELPTPLFAGNNSSGSRDLTVQRGCVVFADARQKIEDPIGRYFTESNIYRVWSLMALPVTLPLDLTYAVTKR